MLEGHLDHPPAALEALLSEMSIGELRPDLWEALHAAAVRDGKEKVLAVAYRKIATDRRGRGLEPAAYAAVLMHAADFHQGILGDATGAESFLRRAVEVLPNFAEAFNRLERRYDSGGDKVALLTLYAAVSPDPPLAPDEVARRALKALVQLTAKTPLPEEACQKLIALSSASPRLLDALDAHCRKTGRAKLACALRETFVSTAELSPAAVLEQRRHLIDLYVGEASAPDLAMPHIEELLRREPTDARARAAAERLLSNREVGSRAAAALQEARRQASSLRPKPAAS
jgi:hypothetical protein